MPRETMMMHLLPELVDIRRIRSDPEYSANDAIEKGASAELGRRYADLITDRLAKVAKAMTRWSEAKLEAFVRAERALVSAQVKGWRKSSPWAAHP